uniref:Uncharacterized protein n=1 Tax=Meloidogyne javanica TaxID=6303 RepID=A0A915LJS8_MELJA
MAANNWNDEIIIDEVEVIDLHHNQNSTNHYSSLYSPYDNYEHDIGVLTPNMSPIYFSAEPTPPVYPYVTHHYWLPKMFRISFYLAGWQQISVPHEFFDPNVPPPVNYRIEDIEQIPLPEKKFLHLKI